MTPSSKGVELKEGDIIKSDYGTTLLVDFCQKSRQYFAYDEAPFPCHVSEETITTCFDVIGHIDETPDFIEVFEADIVKAKQVKREESRKFFWSLLKF